MYIYQVHESMCCSVWLSLITKCRRRDCCPVIGGGIVLNLNCNKNTRTAYLSTKACMIFFKQKKNDSTISKWDNADL